MIVGKNTKKNQATKFCRCSSNNYTGGPGSGKVTHCDTLMEEKRGVTHINMMDLLHQHVISNDMQDFSQLSSKMVTEVLMLEIKMAPAAKAYLISGFPRSMRDVVEYSDKVSTRLCSFLTENRAVLCMFFVLKILQIQVVNGVILISWRQSVLQKQIDYGAKLGHVVLSLAKMELENFFKNVIPVADYFDQSGILTSVNGERNPAEVYKEFRDAVFEILGAEDNHNALLNGVVGMGRGVNDIPGTIVTVETAPDQNDDTVAVSAPSSPIATQPTSSQNKPPSAKNMLLNPSDLLTQSRTVDFANLPPVIWVIGGPGSNKSSLCLKAIAQNPGWSHFRYVFFILFVNQLGCLIFFLSFTVSGV